MYTLRPDAGIHTGIAAVIETLEQLKKSRLNGRLVSNKLNVAGRTGGLIKI